MILIPHGGRGFLALSAILIAIVSVTAGIHAFWSSESSRADLWPFGLSLLISSVLCWLISRFLLASPSPMMIAQETGKKIIVEGTNDHVLFVPVRFWPPILAAIGALICVYDRFGTAPTVDDGIAYEQNLDPYPFPIFVPVTIENTGFTFLLDTSAKFDSLDPELGDVLKPQKERSDGGETGVDDDHVDYFTGPNITLKNWIKRPSPTRILHFAGVRASTGFNVRGAIGIGALKDCALSLDYDHHSLQVLSHNVDAPKGMESLSLESNPDGVPLIKADLRGQPATFVIDTGSANFIALRHETFVKMIEEGAITRDETPDIQTAATTGTLTQLSGHFKTGSLLGVNLNHVPVVDTKEMNRIGAGFLLNFNSIIDFKGGRFFYRRRRSDPPLDTSSMLGASVTYSETHTPVFVIQSPASPIAVAGMKETDHLLRLGALSRADIDAVSLYELCLQQAGKTVDLEVLRAGEVNSTVLHLQLPEKVFIYPPAEDK